MTVELLAAKAQCSASTVWRALRNGDLKAERLLGRTVVRQAEGQRWIDSTTASVPVVASVPGVHYVPIRPVERAALRELIRKAKKK